MKNALFSVSLLALTALCGSGCAAAQKPAVFVTTASIETAEGELVRTLSNEGYPTANVDKKSNVIETEWKDIGALSGDPSGAGSIVRRVTVRLEPTTGGATVSVRMDAKRCERGSYTVDRSEVRGTCEDLGSIPEKLQQEVDSLGFKLQNALSSAS